METEKWPKAADSPLYEFAFFTIRKRDVYSGL